MAVKGKTAATCTCRYMATNLPEVILPGPGDTTSSVLSSTLSWTNVSYGWPMKELINTPIFSDEPSWATTFMILMFPMLAEFP